MEELEDILRKRATRNTSEDSLYAPHPEPDGSADVCPRCGDRGWFTTDVPVGHQEFGRVVTCQCQQQRIDDERHTRLLRYSNLEYLARFTFETLTPRGRSGDQESQDLFEEAHRAALEYAENPSGWLVFSGPNGSGKTHLAAAIGNRRIDGGHVVFYSHVSDLLDHLRATFSPASETAYSDLFEQVKNIPLLILDGLGSHSTSPWAEEKLQQVINHRYDVGLPTIITVTGPLEDLEQFILSRLRTEGLSRIMELQSPVPDRTRRLGRIETQMLQRMTFESFDVRGNNPTAGQRASLEGAHQAAKNFAADPDGWLTLLGNTGVGKTHLAVAIAVEQMKRGNPAFFVLVSDLLDHLRFTFSPESTVTYDHVFEEVKNTPLLILDDLGRQHNTPWAVEKLYQIIVHRYNSRAPTVITAVSDLAETRDPIASRIKDPSLSQLIIIEVPDYRDKKRSWQGQRRSSVKRKATR